MELKRKVLMHSIARTALYFSVIAALVWLGISISNDDHEANYRKASGTCIEKFECPKGHYKSSRISEEFIMVIKEDNGKVFDLLVTPSTYATTSKGDRVSFASVSKEKLGEPTQNNSGWSIAAFALAMLMVAFILPALSFLSAEDIKEKHANELSYADHKKCFE